MIFRFASLQTALTVRFVVAAALPLLVFGLLRYNYLIEQRAAEVSTDLQVHTANIRTEIDEFIDELQSELRLVRNTLNVLGESRQAFADRVLQTVVGTTNHFEAIYLLDSSGRVQNLGLSPQLDVNREDYRGVDFSQLELLKSSHRFRQSRVADFRWSDMFVSPLTGKPTIMLATEATTGVLLATIPLDRLNVMLQRRIRQTEAMVFALVDHHGTLIAHSNAQLALERSNVSILHPEILRALASGNDVPPRRHEDGSLLESVKVVKETGWGIHASVSRDYLRGHGAFLRANLLYSIFTAVLLGSTLAFWMARRLNRHFEKLHEGAKALAEGRPSAFQLPKQGYAEIDDLARHLHDMAAEVLERETFLKASEERYRSVVTNLGEGLLTINSEGLVTDCNPSAERIFNRSRQELINQSVVGGDFRKIYREDGRTVPPEEFPVVASLHHGEVVENQLLGMTRHDGLEIWLQVNSRPLWAADSTVAAAVVSFTDVTGLKLIEESLRRGKERFEELFQQFQTLLVGISDRICLISPQMRILWTNQDSGAGCITEAHVSDGDCCYEQFFSRDEPCPGCPVKRCFDSGEAVVDEITAEHGRIWNLRAFPIMGANYKGGVRQVVLMAEDVTEKRFGEQQRLRANQLAALGELAAGVAHEINNPISGVINYAQLIANYTPGESRENDLARRIIKEGDRIATIVRELLVFSRNETQDVQEVSVREAFGEALTLCEASLRKDQVALKIDLPPTLPKVESRSHQVQQLFLNLLVNARHALSEKHPGADDDKRLSVSGEAVEINGRPFVRIKVRDHGSGIPPELLEKVMNPFFTTKPAGVGTGLGLSISFEIAKRHGGSLALSSEYGQWTEAVVELPAVAS